MNIEIANRLVQLRKKNHLSQEELAARLGISRQAVSKWERAESSPDTDNLILLAKLYQVSLDELLQTEESEEEIRSSQSEESVSQEDGAKAAPPENGGFSGSAGSGTNPQPAGWRQPVWEEPPQGASTREVWAAPMQEPHEDSVAEVLRAAPILSVLVLQLIFTTVPILHSLVAGVFTEVTAFLYLVLGFTTKKWHPGWLVFLMIPLFHAGIVGGFPILITILFLLAGLMFQKWHPAWVLFLLVPIFYAIFGA